MVSSLCHFMKVSWYTRSVLRMDPNLLRECAQRLIETADFIRGSGVNGGSVASSSAPSSTSNTRPRTEDNSSISTGSSGSHRAVPNSAPSVSESARQEHNRIFGYRPPGSSRQGRNFPRNPRQSGITGRNGKAHGRAAAANASWSRSFICLANAGQGCPPSTSERIELTLNGLGEKKIIFPKDGNAGDVHEKILECFPALRGGYELLRAGDGRSKDLILIPMPHNGYNVAYLKSVLGQAKGYLRPLQEDIPLLGKPGDADFSDKEEEPQDNSPKVNCINCHALVPMNNMRGHQDSCSGGSSSGVSRRHRRLQCVLCCF